MEQKKYVILVNFVIICILILLELCPVSSLIIQIWGGSCIYPGQTHQQYMMHKAKINAKYLQNRTWNTYSYISSVCNKSGTQEQQTNHVFSWAPPLYLLLCVRLSFRVSLWSSGSQFLLSEPPPPKYASILR